MSLWKYDCFGTSYLNSNQVYSYFFPTAYIGRNMLHSMITKRTYLPIFSHTTTATLLARRLRIGIGIMLRHKDNRSACTICGQLWGKKRYQNCRDYQRYYKRGYWQYLKQKCRVQQPSSVAASCVGFCFTSFCNNLPWLYLIGVVAERFNIFLNLSILSAEHISTLGKSIPCKKLCYINPIEQHPYFFLFRSQFMAKISFALSYRTFSSMFCIRQSIRILLNTCVLYLLIQNLLSA